MDNNVKKLLELMKPPDHLIDLWRLITIVDHNSNKY